MTEAEMQALKTQVDGLVAAQARMQGQVATHEGQIPLLLAQANMVPALQQQVAQLLTENATLRAARAADQDRLKKVEDENAALRVEVNTLRSDHNALRKDFNDSNAVRRLNELERWKDGFMDEIRKLFDTALKALRQELGISSQGQIPSPPGQQQAKKDSRFIKWVKSQD